MEEEYQGKTHIIGTLINLCLVLLWIAAITGVFIYIAYLLAIKFFDPETEKANVWVFTGLFTYLIYCVIYFFKGICIALRTRGTKWWILPWIICYAACCIVPAFMIYMVFAAMFDFDTHKELWYKVLSWAVFVISLHYLNTIYRFKTPGAPAFTYWSYNLGCRIIR